MLNTLKNANKSTYLSVYIYMLEENTLFLSERKAKGDDALILKSMYMYQHKQVSNHGHFHTTSH